jgi:hypothetical protein
MKEDGKAIFTLAEECKFINIYPYSDKAGKKYIDIEVTPNIKAIYPKKDLGCR